MPTNMGPKTTRKLAADIGCLLPTVYTVGLRTHQSPNFVWRDTFNEPLWGLTETEAAPAKPQDFTEPADATASA